MHNPVTQDPATAPIRAGLPRLVEMSIALLGLLVMGPFIGLAALFIIVTSGRPAFFRQERVGRHGRLFVLYKLRTMRPSHTGPQVTAGDDMRITRIGRVLRKTKLDEFPELWNILKGEMSLVGPRPEVPRYVNLNDPLWRITLAARPGITDPVTLRLRNEEALLAEVKSDCEQFYLATLLPWKLVGYRNYLRTRSWRLDLQILLQTLTAVVFPRKAPLPTLEEIQTLPHDVHHRSYLKSPL